MTDVEVKVVRVRGTCNAELREGDSYLVRNLRIIPLKNDKVCQVAFASVTANIGRMRLLKVPIYISCPDPGTGDGGNVILKISQIEQHENDQS